MDALPEADDAGAAGRGRRALSLLATRGAPLASLRCLAGGGPRPVVVSAVSSVSDVLGYRAVPSAVDLWGPR